MIRMLALLLTVAALTACNASQTCETCPADGPTPDKSPAKTGDAASKSMKLKPGETISLFDGETLGRWKSTEFGGEGNVHIEDGKIILPFGSMMTGITWQGEVPARMNYQITVEAMRVDGNDFFCGLTFPVGKDPCSLICGGWGGGVTGLSSLNRYDASENETSSWFDYKQGQWYTIRLRVEPKRIQAWIDDKQIVDVNIEDYEIGIRPEVEPSVPLGIASFTTTAAIRKITMTKLK